MYSSRLPLNVHIIHPPQYHPRRTPENLAMRYHQEGKKEEEGGHYPNQQQTRNNRWGKSLFHACDLLHGRNGSRSRNAKCAPAKKGMIHVVRARRGAEEGIPAFVRGWTGDSSSRNLYASHGAVRAQPTACAGAASIELKSPRRYP